MSDPTTTTETITLTVNGEQRTVPPGTTVLGLLESLDLVPGTVVVERNRRILPRDDYGEVTLADGDRLELVHFVGGG
jgi:thiamine biosynthesis protein ThiS